MYVAGNWLEKVQSIEVLNPFDNSVLDTVPRATADDVEKALVSAVEGAKVMRRLSHYERFLILKRASELVEQRAQDLAETITLEEGKVISESRFEVSRAVQTLSCLKSEEGSGGNGSLEAPDRVTDGTYARFLVVLVALVPLIF
jgi:glyceraldehyde-3-phosphate dehydrogenase (NADP+)